MSTIAYRPVSNAYVNFITGGSDIDWVVVDRLVAGIPVRSNRAERIEAAAIMTRRGMSAAEIAEQMRCSDRSVVRYRGVSA